MSKIIMFPTQFRRAIQPPTGSAIVKASGTQSAASAPPAEAVASAIAGVMDDGDIGPVLEVAQLVALVLRTCRRLGHKPSRLSPILAADLERHCALGDPTARLLKDWLADRSFPLAIPEAIAAAEASTALAGEG